MTEIIFSCDLSTNLFPQDIRLSCLLCCLPRVFILQTNLFPKKSAEFHLGDRRAILPRPAEP